jgi:PAS domain S-box-containing protein
MALAVEYAAVAIIPAAYLQFSLQYSRRTPLTDTRSWALSLTGPALLGFFVLATMILQPAGLLSAGSSYSMAVFWIFNAYSSLLMLAGLAIVIQKYQSTTGIFRGQLACLLIAATAPLLLYYGYIFRIPPFDIIDLAPVGCIVSVVALAAGIERYSLFDIVPVEYAAVLRRIPAGIVVLDVDGRIIEINPRARKILGIGEQEITGSRISAFLPPDGIPPHSPQGNRGEQRFMIQREHEGSLCYIDVRCIQLQPTEDTPADRVMLLSDITDQKLTEQSLNMARKNINLLTGITRHDILNQLTVIVLHNEILLDAVSDPALARSLSEQERAAKNIRRQIAFTKDYEKLGENLPQWLDVKKLFVQHQEKLGYEYIHYSIHVEGLEVFADPLMERVFYNLLDNSLRFGEKVTTIRLYYRQHLDGLTVVYEDNGIGVPAQEKNLIFQRGYGQMSGFGLYFSKEILGITGITIKENGEEGNGARFEIAVPWGKFRFRRE